MGGLCNRLRFIFSFIKKLIDEKKLEETELYIIWRKNDSCNGFISKYIEPIKNVNFINKTEDKIDIISSGIVKGYHKINYMKDFPLYLKDNIYQEIRKFLKKIGDKYISLHIRKTDLEENLKKNKPKRTYEEEYIKFIEENKGKKIFIATDNKDTQNKLKKLYKNRLLVYEDIKCSNDLRQTNIEHSIIDLFLCILSYSFKGTHYSSFTRMILLRETLDSKRSSISKLKKFKKSNHKFGEEVRCQSY